MRRNRGKRSVPTLLDSSGVWDMNEAYEARLDNIWPTPTIIQTGLSIHLDAGNPLSYPGSGTSWYDLSPNPVTATLVNSPTFNANGYFDIAGGGSSYISFPNSKINHRTNDFTYCIWLQADVYRDHSTVFENGSWTDTLLFRLQSTTDLYVYMEGGGIGGKTWNPNYGNFEHLVLRRQSGTLQWFANNVSLGTVSNSTDINLANTNCWLMRSQHSSGQHMDGKIAIFAVYSRALSDAELTYNYNVYSDRFGF